VILLHRGTDIKPLLAHLLYAFLSGAARCECQVLVGSLPTGKVLTTALRSLHRYHRYPSVITVITGCFVAPRLIPALGSSGVQSHVADVKTLTQYLSCTRYLVWTLVV